MGMIILVNKVKKFDKESMKKRIKDCLTESY